MTKALMLFQSWEMNQLDGNINGNYTGIIHWNYTLNVYWSYTKKMKIQIQERLK